MTSMFRTAARTFLLTLGCASTAYAFPPCPVGEAGILPLDAPPPPDIVAMSPWKVATVSAVGTVIPDSFTIPCAHLPSIIRSGQCTIDSFDLRTLPAQASVGKVGAKPSYSVAGRVGLAGLPDVRNADVALHKPAYALILGINATPLAHADDWIDIAQMEFESGSNVDAAPGMIYRLRKTTRRDGQSELRLILADPRMGEDVVVAAVPLGSKDRIVPIVLDWSPKAESLGEAGTDSAVQIGPPIVDPYTASTGLTLEVDGTLVYARTLKDQAPSIASMGLLDYNLPDVTRTARTDAVVAADAVPEEGTIDAVDPLETLQQQDLPGNLLIFYYTQFSVVSK
jgi:hypothetical protein